MFKCWNLQMVKSSNLQMFQWVNWVHRKVRLISMFQGSNVPMFKSSYNQMFKCSNVQMFKFSNVQMFQWSNGPMLECLDIQMFNHFGYSQGFFFRNAMYFNSLSGAGVSSGWVNHKVRLVSRFKSSNAPMFQCSNVQMLKCSNVQIWNVPMFKCSNLWMFQIVYIWIYI